MKRLIEQTLWSNKAGTGDRSDCRCRTRIEHWKLGTGNEELPKECAVYGCHNAPEVGAHVYKKNSNDKREYIVPLCKCCNNKKNWEFQLDADAWVVKANRFLTCERPDWPEDYSEFGYPDLFDDNLY